jgi:acylphosphatase
MGVGSPAALDQLEEWLGDGPRMARVDAVEAEEIPVPASGPEGFTTQ